MNGDLSKLPSELCRRGLYRRVGAWIRSGQWQTLNDDECSWCLFALYFSGEWQEAEHFRRSWFVEKKKQTEAFVFFARSVARVRAGELDQARRDWIAEFAHNRAADKQMSRAAHRGWLLQTQAFLSMQQSRWEAAERWSSRAVGVSLLSGDLLLRAIALDMQAHASVRLGHFSAALRFAQQALVCAKSLGNVGIENAIRVSVACWESERGTHPERSMRTLRSLLKEKSFHDTLSQSVLLLELSRALMLLGEFAQAEQILSRAERTLSGTRSRPLFRQSVALAQRKALLARLTGRSEEAVFLLEGVFSTIPSFEKSLQLEVRGQMISAAREAEMSVPEEWLREEKELTRVVRTDRAQRTLRRRDSGGVLMVSSLDDRLAGWMDRLSRSGVGVSLARDILKSGFAGLLVPRGNRRSENTLYLLNEGHDLLLVTPRRAKYLGEKPPAQLLALIQCLSMRSVSKEELFRTLWKRRYFPERDDANVYVLVRRLRQLLGEEHELLDCRRGFYSLQIEREPLQLQNTSANGPTAGGASQSLNEKFRVQSFPPSIEFSETGRDKHLASLPNVRLLQLKEWLLSQGSVSAEDWQRHAGISRASACRDLLYCLQNRWVEKIGRGRAVVYVPVKS